jgi:hypothetical protein
MSRFILPLLAAAAAAPAIAADPAPRAAEEVRIPFPDRGGIRSFHAEGNDVLYVQDRRRNWYRAELVGQCLGLGHALRVGFDTRGSSVFDRFSQVVVGGERCPIASLEPSEKPRKKRRKA